jgi:hypothetical protein
MVVQIYDTGLRTQHQYMWRTHAYRYSPMIINIIYNKYIYVCVCALPVYKQGLVHRARGVPQEDAVPGGCARAAAGTRWPAVSVCLRLSHGPATVDGGGDHVCVVSVLIPSSPPPPPSYPSHPPPLQTLLLVITDS